MKLVSPIEHLSLVRPMLAGHSSELYLASSIVLETACTMCLANVNNNKLWFIPIYAGYGVSFYLFPKCLDKFSLNMAYTLWSGFGIMFAVFSWLQESQILILELGPTKGFLALFTGILLYLFFRKSL